MLAKDQAARAEAIIAALPVRTRAAYLMRRDQEMSFADIGAALGVSATRAHQLASAALRAMMDGLDDPDDPAPP
ncbi:MAG: sigma factor-like helix-turn-helix DNA-binding protein [Pseudomonadota bacterium]